MEKVVNIIGAGLAGSEMALQLAKRKIRVKLFEAKPLSKSLAHQSNNFAELVCSNSFRSSDILNAVGLLKEEMRLLGSFIMKAAELSKIPGGTSLQVDRELFSETLTKWIKENKYIEVIEEVVKELKNGITVIATGPVTLGLEDILQSFVGKDNLYFYDAVAPIISKDSINFEKAFYKSRYDKGEATYLNCPMNEKEFKNFYKELINGQKTETKEELKLFSGCMAIEEMARLGEKTVLFGPMKPVGLDHNGEKHYAVVQLRQDNLRDTMYNMVGFQTSLKIDEQKRIFRMIPGLENASFLRYGKMHRNTYLGKSGVLDENYRVKENPNVFVIGQLSGVEGYLESASTGLLAGINLARSLNGKEMIDFTSHTAIGSLAKYISMPNENFAPMNVNYGLFTDIPETKRKMKRTALVNRSLKIIEGLINEGKI